MSIIVSLAVGLSEGYITILLINLYAPYKEGLSLTG